MGRRDVLEIEPVVHRRTDVVGARSHALVFIGAQSGLLGNGGIGQRAKFGEHVGHAPLNSRRRGSFPDAVCSGMPSDTPPRETRREEKRLPPLTHVGPVQSGTLREFVVIRRP